MSSSTLTFVVTFRLFIRLHAYNEKLKREKYLQKRNCFRQKQKLYSSRCSGIYFNMLLESSCCCYKSIYVATILKLQDSTHFLFPFLEKAKHSIESHRIFSRWVGIVCFLFTSLPFVWVQEKREENTIWQLWLLNTTDACKRCCFEASSFVFITLRKFEEENVIFKSFKFVLLFKKKATVKMWSNNLPKNQCFL